MSIASSLNLLAEIVPSCCRSSDAAGEDLMKILAEQIDEFLHDELNDECACALLNLLCQTQTVFLHSSSLFHREKNQPFNSSVSFVLVERKCDYWRSVLKIASIPSDLVRERFTKIVPKIIDDPRLTGSFIR